MIAAEYPFLDVTWTTLVFFLWVIWFRLLSARSLSSVRVPVVSGSPLRLLQTVLPTVTRL